MRVLQIGSDRSKRGILYPDSAGAMRQATYGEQFGALDIIGFSLKADGRKAFGISARTHIYPTDSASKIFYGLDTIRIMRGLPRPDVISAQDPFEVGLLALLLSRMYGIPLHVQVHTDFLAPGYTQHSVVNRLRAAVARIVLRRAVRIRVVSARVRDEIVKRYGIKAPITVLPIFVDLERLRSPRSDLGAETRFNDFQMKLLVVSRLEAEKNVALAISSFAQSAPADACLIIIGAGSERASLERLTREKGIASRVFFEGEKDAIDYYPLADLLLVPSRYEGYGLVIIEALAAGKPVLSTDVGIARESGAIVANEEQYPAALAKWFANGPKEIHLKEYPYKDFNDYVEKYCADIAASIKK